MEPSAKRLWRPAAAVPRLFGCQRGAVAIMFAIAIIPLVIAVGLGIDLWRAFAAKARLQAALDEAALAISSTNPASFTTAQMQQRATAFFNANFPSGVVGKAGTVTLSFATTGPSTNPNVIVTTGSATVPTTFMNIIGVPYLTLNAIAEVTLASPNIDFYMLLDDSPSMLIGASSADITTLINNTQYECDSYGSSPSGNSNCGCGFACHESNPSGDTCSLSSAESSGSCASLGPVCPSQQTCTGTRFHRTCGPPYTLTSTTGCNPNIDPNTGNVNADNYAEAQKLGVTLRLDNLRTATTSLMTTAQTTENSNAAIYRVAIYTFDYQVNTIQAAPPTSNLTTAQTAAATIAPLEVYTNNCVTSSNCNNDTDTNYDNAMSTLNGIMPAPGNGTNFPGDTPKEVLYFVTDGEEDETVPNAATSASSCPSPSTMTTTPATYDCSGSRQESVMDPTWCTTIKNRGILIAVLYLVYDPIPNNGWYTNHASAYNSQIATNLQNCATPGLFFQVATGGDVTTAMATLFQNAINVAYLSR
jgi:Flp pilus assembly protein TadG